MDPQLGNWSAKIPIHWLFGRCVARRNVVPHPTNFSIHFQRSTYMNKRIAWAQKSPEAYKAMVGLEMALGKSGLDGSLLELIRLRASQINGCAYCVNMHTNDARKLGETEQRIYLMSVWREAPNVFNEEEQLLLAITEEVTLIHQHGLSDELYNKAINIFGEEKTAQIIMAIV